jgi:hypothetical protein
MKKLPPGIGRRTNRFIFKNINKNKNKIRKIKTKRAKKRIV